MLKAEEVVVVERVGPACYISRSDDVGVYPRSRGGVADHAVV